MMKEYGEKYDAETIKREASEVMGQCKRVSHDGHMGKGSCADCGAGVATFAELCEL